MRNFIFISSGILFILISAGLVIIGSGEKDQFLIIISAMAIPFLFVGIWNLLQVFYESKAGVNRNEYFTYSSVSGAGMGAFYSKIVIVPVFVIMFGTVSIAILTGFLASNRSTEDISIIAVAVSFIFAVVITVVFVIRINRNLRESRNSLTD